MSSPVDGRNALRERSRYLTPSAAHRSLGLYCLGVGWQQGMAVPMRRRQLRSYAAVLITRGAGHLQVDRRAAWSLQAPVLFWLFPHTVHSYAPIRPGWSESWVLFDGIAGHAHEQLGHLSRSDPVVGLEPGSPVPELITGLVDEVLAAGTMSEAAAAVRIQQLVLAAARPRQDRAAGAAAALVAELEARATEPGSIEDHARHLGVTTARLRHAVRDHGGDTVQDVIISARMRLAKELLAVTDLPVYRVAGRVGYHDAAYFTRLFGRREGLAPSEFRAQHARTAGVPTGS